MDTTETRNFVIPAANLPGLTIKIEKLNRRARRLGCSPIVLTVGAASIKEMAQEILISGGPDERRKVRVKCHDVTITGERPKLPGGWHLVGRLQLLDGVAILHTVPGETVPRHFHDAHNRCDHCNVNRTRNDVYVIRNESGRYRDIGGKYMVVGSTCIADFLGGVSPTQMAWYAESLAALDCRDFERFGGGNVAAEMDVERYLTAAACAIRLAGWIAKGVVQFTGGPCTASYATQIYNRDLHQADDGLTTSALSRYGAPYPVVETTEADATEATAALAWAQAINLATANDYLINVQKVSDLSYAPWNLSGIAASIVSAYQREQGRLAVANRTRTISEHIGTVGERQTFRLTVENVYGFSSKYGTTHLHSFRDMHGNVIKWFSTSEVLTEGTTYDVTGTIKAHGTYKNIAETVLTRCKSQKVAA